jgi:sugar phosphate isomerase/epimerase
MELGLFSVSYAGYWSQQKLELPAFIAKAAQLGYDAVMLAGKRPHLSPLDVDSDRLASIKNSLQEHKIRCAVIGGYTDLGPTAAAEVPYFEMQIAYVESLARIAAELGATVVRVFTAYEIGGPPSQTDWAGAVRALQEMCDRAAVHGVTVAIQNHHDLAVHTETLEELLGDVNRPNCRVGFDAWSLALRGEELYEAAKRMAPHAAITTNADYIRLPRFRYQSALINYRREDLDLVRAVKFGEGFIDYQAFFCGLKEGGFDGIATYEMCSPIRGGGAGNNLDEYAAHYVNWMRAHAH